MIETWSAWAEEFATRHPVSPEDALALRVELAQRLEDVVGLEPAKAREFSATAAEHCATLAKHHGYSTEAALDVLHGELWHPDSAEAATYRFNDAWASLKRSIAEAVPECVWRWIEKLGTWSW